MSCGLWFGTEEYMQWIETPNSGADVSPQSRTASGTDVNGGGYVFGSRGSHRLYTYAWRNSSARSSAQKMKNYFTGMWGKGLIYFVDPLTYDTNILPQRWSNPGETLDFEGPSLVYGIAPKAVQMPAVYNEYPLIGAEYDLTLVPSGIRRGESVFIPIPEGFDLIMGAAYSGTGTGGVYWVGVDSNGNNSSPTPVTPVEAIGSSVTGGPRVGSGQYRGIRLFIGKTGNGSASVQVLGITARLVRSSITGDVHSSVGASPFFAGQGNSGCKFDGAPTYVEYNGVGGGQVGFAATFREVGDWV